MQPGSLSQLFEERIARLGDDVDDILRIAQEHPEVVAQQDIDTQMALSRLQLATLAQVVGRPALSRR